MKIFARILLATGLMAGLAVSCVNDLDTEPLTKNILIPATAWERGFIDAT